MDGRIWLVCFWAYFICLSKTGAIDVDYYMTYLRTVDCDSEKGDDDCRARCNNEAAMCHRGECSCDTVKTASRITYKRSNGGFSEVLVYDENNRLRYNSDETPKEIENRKKEMTQRPALRHHIAHFCPNLNEARKCIRKCMEEGKPAFCGKDHTCYCGHKYSPHDKKSVANAEEVYKNFQNLYEKYFGKKPAGEDTIVESED